MKKAREMKIGNNSISTPVNRQIFVVMLELFEYSAWVTYIILYPTNWFSFCFCVYRRIASDRSPASTPQRSVSASMNDDNVTSANENDSRRESINIKNSAPEVPLLPDGNIDFDGEFGSLWEFLPTRNL